MDDVRAQMRLLTKSAPATIHPFLSGGDLLNLQRFRDLFRYQGLDPSLRLRLGSLTLLFTDLKGSTALYEATGDITAYSVVREHFQILLGAVRTHQGAVVKTMGDAVMASFSNPIDATRAALSMLRGMAAVTQRVGQLGYHTGLKVGIHEGTALAVANDDRLDFFGQTVNIAARVQALADADEVCVTARVMQMPGVLALFHEHGYTATSSEVELRGVGGRTEVFRFAVS
jgi:class 3 adenylate cyclase